MGNNYFDKFITSNTGKNLTPPDSLNWENMDIPFPQKKKKKKRGFFFMWLGLLGLTLVSSYFFLSNMEKKSTEENIQFTIANKNEPTKVRETDANLENKISQQDIYKNKTSQNKLGEDQSLKNKTLPVSKENLKSFKNPQILKSNEEVIIADSLHKKTTLVLASKSEELNKTPLQVSDDFAKEALSIQGINSLTTLLEVPLTMTQLLNLDSLFEPSNIQNLDSLPTSPKKDKLKVTLFLNFGSNISRSNFSSASQVDSVLNAEGAAFGNTYSLGWRVPLKNDFFIETGFSFQKLHTTFSYSKYLGFTIDLIERQKTYRTKHIFHNNYFKYLELNLGVGKNFSFGKNWGSEIILHFNPTYILSNQGRTFDEDQTIVFIEDFEATQKWLWSADLGLNLFYQIRNNKVFTGFNFKQHLSKIKVLENSNLKMQPQVLNFHLGILRNF